jgi:AraC-like DNA-binding protein
MNAFSLKHGESPELELFGHIAEVAILKNTSVQLNSLSPSSTESIRLYYILEGKFDWIINGQLHKLFPGDLAVILPGHVFGSEKGFLDIGSLFQMHIKVERDTGREKLILGNWSGLSESEWRTIGTILQLNKTSVLFNVRDVVAIMSQIHSELTEQQIAYATRVNHLLDELLIAIARQSNRQSNQRRDFPETFMKVEATLRKDLTHQWTVDEMAALVGLGTTAFTERVKSYTGFTPLNYLINIRISEAMKMLNKSELSITEIALDLGFYSSQHFSTTFKKLTGYTPADYRKRNSTDN